MLVAMLTAARWGVLALAALVLVVAPFALFGGATEIWVAEILASDPSRTVLVGLVVLAMASDILLPIPSSVVATAAGALLGLGLGALANWIGLSIGVAVGYAIGNAGRGVAGRFVGAEQLAVADRVFARRGDAMVAVFRPIPVLAEVSVVFAGVAAMPRRRFALYAGLANLGIAVGYAALGAWASAANEFAVAVAGSLGLPAIAMLLGRLATRSAPTPTS